MTTFRIPVLETFIWQKEIDGFISDESQVTPVEGNRFIINEPTHLKYNNICSYNGKEWLYDVPKIGMTTIIKNGTDYTKPDDIRVEVAFELNEINLDLKKID